MTPAEDCPYRSARFIRDNRQTTLQWVKKTLGMLEISEYPNKSSSNLYAWPKCRTISDDYDQRIK